MDSSFAFPEKDGNSAHPELLFAPFLVIRVPRNRFFNALFYGDCRFPSQEALCFLYVRRMVAELIFPVRNIVKAAMILFGHFQDELGNIENADAFPGADIDHLAADGSEIYVKAAVNGAA